MSGYVGDDERSSSERWRNSGAARADLSRRGADQGDHVTVRIAEMGQEPAPCLPLRRPRELHPAVPRLPVRELDVRDRERGADEAADERAALVVAGIDPLERELSGSGVELSPARRVVPDHR